MIFLQLLELSTDISSTDIRMFTVNMTGKNEIHFFMQSNLLPSAITCQKKLKCRMLTHIYLWDYICEKKIKTLLEWRELYNLLGTWKIIKYQHQSPTMFVLTGWKYLKYWYWSIWIYKYVNILTLTYIQGLLRYDLLYGYIWNILNISQIVSWHH